MLSEKVEKPVTTQRGSAVVAKCRLLFQHLFFILPARHLHRSHVPVRVLGIEHRAFGKGGLDGGVRSGHVTRPRRQFDAKRTHEVRRDHDRSGKQMKSIEREYQTNAGLS